MANLPPPHHEVSRPDVGALVSYLSSLIKAWARYEFAFGPWLDVVLWKNEVKGWFENLLYYLGYSAYWYANQFYLVLNEYAAAIADFANRINDGLKAVIANFNTFVLPILEWWDDFFSTLDYIVRRMFTFLWSLYNRTYSTISGILGATWTWVRKFYYNQYYTISTILGVVWTWARSFYAAPVAYIESKLGAIWTWVKSVYADPYRRLSAILGAVWIWATAFYNAPLATVDKWTGGAITFLRSLFALSPSKQLQFVAGAMGFWQTVYSTKRTPLSQFLADPAGYVLAALRDVFLGWFEQLIADNW